MKTQIGVTLQVEGFHNWPDAPAAVDFLRERHRHIFHIVCVKQVTHDDRDVEFILFKRVIERHLSLKYSNSLKGSWCEFGAMSCEMIASELLEAFGLSHCKVSEDEENFAIVTATNTPQRMSAPSLKKSPVVLVSGYLCSGKGTYIKEHLHSHTRIGVSDIVKGIIGKAKRSELQDTAHLAKDIAKLILAQITIGGKEVIDGIRQPEVFQAVIEQLNQWGVPFRLIWTEASFGTIRDRFNTRADGKDNISFQEAFDKDLALGIDTLERRWKNDFDCLVVNG